MGEGEYRPEVGLRLPQRRAVAFVQAYLSVRANRRDAAGEAALDKMPTGTGKTAVIAALACTGLGPAKTLILTPRKALVRQMTRDLATRFWRKLGAAYSTDGLKERLAPDESERLAESLVGARSPVKALNADQYSSIWADRGRERQVWVGTFNALHRILAIAPPPHRDFYGREHDAPGVEIELGVEPGLASGQNVPTVLLCLVGGLFLRGMSWRRK